LQEKNGKKDLQQMHINIPHALQKPEHSILLTDENKRSSDKSAREIEHKSSGIDYKGD
jgi:hypothetical protein